jgi:predicted enzyme related to lactoylglutathione lyase
MPTAVSTYPVVAVLRAENLDRARTFYRDVLGLTEDRSQPVEGVAFFSAGGGTQISIYERHGMPAPENTTLAIPVPPSQFDMVADQLRQAGVKFEDYNIPEMGLKTVNGIANYGGSKSAWFKDSEGNILNLVSM